VAFAAALNFECIGSNADFLTSLGVLCIGAPLISSIEELLLKLSGYFDCVYVLRPNNGSRVLNVMPHISSELRIIYGIVDLHYLRLENQAEVENREDLKAASRDMKEAEFRIMAKADAVVTYSVMEAEIISRQDSTINVHTVPWSITPTRNSNAHGMRRDMAFIGGYLHTPNVDGAIFLVRDVMPLVWAQRADIKCILVGSNMPPHIAALASSHVETRGFVPDLREVYETVRLTVAPMRYGAGLKGKVLGSLAAGVPCILTTAAAAGMGLPSLLEGLIADGPASLANLIVKVYDSPDLYSDMSNVARHWIEETYGEGRIDEGLSEIFRPIPGWSRGQMVLGIAKTDPTVVAPTHV
jgi:glycosyltransferase involved in cell wall biosynthesis